LGDLFFKDSLERRESHHLGLLDMLIQYLLDLFKGSDGEGLVVFLFFTIYFQVEFDLCPDTLHCIEHFSDTELFGSSLTNLDTSIHMFEKTKVQGFFESEVRIGLDFLTDLF
jgi:hypothetical protein